MNFIIDQKTSSDYCVTRGIKRIPFKMGLGS